MTLYEKKCQLTEHNECRADYAFCENCPYRLARERVAKIKIKRTAPQRNWKLLVAVKQLRNVKRIVR